MIRVKKVQELDFIRQEMRHYGVAAQLLLRSGSGAEYEITVLPDGAVQITAGMPVARS